MILKIVQVGDPVLRKRARALAPDEIGSPRITELIEMMRDTMRDAPGVGLAAPQIGVSLQLAVIEDTTHGMSAEALAVQQRSPVPFHVLINPTLRVEGEDVIEAYEGCLSFASFMMVVPRAVRVHVDALDETGTARTIDATGWYARILQHEIDHLHGIVCCDRMDSRTLTTVDNHARRR